MFPVEAFRETLTKAIRIFKQLNIRYHLTGGIASVYYGEPRMTQDIDIVIDNAQVRAQLDVFIQSLVDSDFIFDSKAVRVAVSGKGMFQLLDGVESLKLDLYPRELIPGELDRSVTHEIFENLELPVVSHADVGASKLVWIHKGSHKSRRDLRKIFLMATEIDRARIQQLASQMGLTELLEEVLEEPDEIS